MSLLSRVCACLFVIVVLATIPAFAARDVYEARGENAAAIQSAVDAFRQALGANNGVGSTFPSGRREINWDAVPDSFAAPNLLPGNFFNSNSPRGAVFVTAGTGFQVSAKLGNPTSTPLRFGNLNLNYPLTFTAFSQERLFASLGSPLMDVYFFLPGTNTPATVSAFGAVFCDVDSASAAWLELFDPAGVSLGKVPVAAGSGSQTFSFLGVRFTAGERIARVRIQSGSTQLGVNDAPPNGDMVVMDDFIYAEPSEDRARPAIPHYLPQVADGSGYRTAILLTNPHPFLATGKTEFFSGDGKSLTLNINGRATSAFDFAIPPRGVLRLQTDGSSTALKTGYARVVADQELNAVALFQLLDNANNLLTEASVLKAAPQQRLVVFSQVNSSINTGIAVINTSSQAALLVLRLLNTAGLPVAEQVLSMAPGEQWAKFVDELFSGFSGVRNFEGALVLYSSDPIAVTAVRMQLQPTLTLSALPVAALNEEGGRRDFDIRPFLGSYRGTWTNPAAGTSGAARIDITANLVSRTATVTIDFDGNYLGLNDPPPQTLNGTFDVNGTRVRGSGNVFGNLDVFIDASGNIVGFVTQLAGGTIPRMTYTGLLTPTRLDAEYLLLLPDGSLLTSILRMERSDY